MILAMLDNHLIAVQNRERKPEIRQEQNIYVSTWMYISLMLQHNANGVLNKKHLLWSGNGVIVVQFIHYIN